MKLNLGCGNKLKQGFLNIDILDMPHLSETLYQRQDLTQGLPSGVKDVNFVYSEHFFEHITLEQALNLLNSCYEKMVSGAEIKIVVPDTYRLCEAYVNKDYAHFEPIKYASPNNILMEYVNYHFYGEGHQFQYDRDYLSKVLSYVGFDVKDADYEEGLDSPERRQFSLYMIGVKP